MTTSRSRGMSSVRFFRLCSRAPPIRMNSLLMAANFVFESNGKITQNDRECKADANEGSWWGEATDEPMAGDHRAAASLPPANPLARLPVNMRMQHAHEGQVAVAFGEVQAVADHKFVRHGEPGVIGFDGFDAARRFVEQHTDFDPSRFERGNFGQHAVQGLAG